MERHVHYWQKYRKLGAPQITGTWGFACMCITSANKDVPNTSQPAQGPAQS